MNVVGLGIGKVLSKQPLFPKFPPWITPRVDRKDLPSFLHRIIHLSCANNQNHPYASEDQTRQQRYRSKPPHVFSLTGEPKKCHNSCCVKSDRFAMWCNVCQKRIKQKDVIAFIPVF